MNKVGVQLGKTMELGERRDMEAKRKPFSFVIPERYQTVTQQMSFI